MGGGAVRFSPCLNFPCQKLECEELSDCNLRAGAVPSQDGSARKGAG